MKNHPNLTIDLSSISWKYDQCSPSIKKREKANKKSPIRHRESVSSVGSIYDKGFKEMEKDINLFQKDDKQKGKSKKK